MVRLFSCLPRLSLVLVLVAQLSSLTAHADTVDAGNITTFANGQPALADDVNGNFSELIAQINDHANRLNDVEASGLFLGDSTVVVDCNTEGADALQTAIESVNSAVGALTIAASGACGEISISRRGVIIVGTNLSITADSANPLAFDSAVTVLSADARFISGQGSTFFNIVGNGERNALVLNQDSQVLMAGVNIAGATEIQTAVSGQSTLAFIGTNTIGTASDGVTGLRALQSRVLLLATETFPTATLNINSSGVGIQAVSSTFLTLELDPGSTQLSIPNAVELDFQHNSVGIFGPMTFGDGGGDKIRISDNSSVNIDGSSLFDSGESGTILAGLQLDRGGMLRFDFENAPGTASFTHGGNAEIGINSAVDVFGASDASLVSFASGSGSTVDVNVNSSLVLNAATFAADTLNVLNSTAVFAPNSVFDDGQPAINVSYEGTVIDLSGILTGDVTDCIAGGIAYNSTPVEVCP